MNRRKYSVLVFMITILLAVTGCGGGAQSSGGKIDQSQNASVAPSTPPKTLRLIFNTATSVGYLPYYIAEQEGYFKKQGLKVETFVISSPIAVIQALQSNEGDIAFSSTAPFTSAVEKGGKLAIIGTTNNKAPFSLIAGKNIQKLEDLKGKTIAASTLQDVGTAMVLKMVSKVNLKKEDISFIAAGGSPERMVAMEKGAVDAVVLTAPYDFKLMAKGFKLMGRYNEPFEFLSFVGVKKHLEENTDQTVAFLRVMGEAIDWLYEPKNREKVENLLEKKSNISPEEAKQTYDLYINELQVFPKQARINRQSLQNMLDISKEIGALKGNLKVDDLIDERYWRQAFEKK